MMSPTPLNHQETTMKITVIKKATTAKPTGYCIAYIDDGLLAKR